MGDISTYPQSGGAFTATLGYIENFANSQTFTNTTVDLTGAALTVNVLTGRTLRITGKVHLSSSIVGDRAILSIREGSTIMNDSYYISEQVSIGEDVFVTAIVRPTAGAHTYKLSAVRQNGTGTWSVYSIATEASFLLIEDITGAPWPVGQTLYTGMFANELWTDYTPTLVQSATVPKTVNYAKYQRRGRRVDFRLKLTVSGAGGVAANAVKVGLPPFPCTETADYTFGQGFLFDASASASFKLLCSPASNNTEMFLLPTDGTVANVLGATGFTAALASPDVIVAAGTYEAAV
jgi:hypothetical protein